MQAADIQVIKEIPGYKVIMKAVLKSQIQQLVEQLASHTGEESVILTASVAEGTLSHLGSDSGKVFLETNDDIKTQFLGFCLKRHHKQKQLEKEKQEQEEQQKALMELEMENSLLNIPTTPTRYAPGLRQRFTPTRVQTSPRQPQFSPRFQTSPRFQASPRFQTSPRQSFGSPRQSFASPQAQGRFQQVPLRGVSPQNNQRMGLGNVRHEPYPAARPRRPALNFNQQGRSPNINQKQTSSSMKLPTETQKIKKINIDPNEIIKIEAADDEDDLPDISKSKTKQSERTSSGDIGIKIASVSGATEASIIAGTSQPGNVATHSGEARVSRTPSVSSAPSPSLPSQPSTPTSLHIPSPIPKEELSNSSASSTHNERMATTFTDTLPPEGLSLDSNLSRLTGIPSNITQMDQTGSKTPSTASDSDTASAALGKGSSSVNIKTEALTEMDVELLITGIESGQKVESDNKLAANISTRMNVGQSTSGAPELGDTMNQEYNKSVNAVKRTVETPTAIAPVSSAPLQLSAHVQPQAPAKTATVHFAKPSVPNVFRPIASPNQQRSSLDVYKAHEKDAIKSWTQSEAAGNETDDVIIVEGDDTSKGAGPEVKRRRVIEEKQSENSRYPVSRNLVKTEAFKPGNVNTPQCQGVLNATVGSGREIQDDIVILDPEPDNKAAIKTVAMAGRVNNVPAATGVTSVNVDRSVHVKNIAPVPISASVTNNAPITNVFPVRNNTPVKSEFAAINNAPTTKIAPVRNSTPMAGPTDNIAHVRNYTPMAGSSPTTGNITHVRSNTPMVGHAGNIAPLRNNVPMTTPMGNIAHVRNSAPMAAPMASITPVRSSPPVLTPITNTAPSMTVIPTASANFTASYQPTMNNASPANNAQASQNAFAANNPPVLPREPLVDNQGCQPMVPMVTQGQPMVPMVTQCQPMVPMVTQGQPIVPMVTQGQATRGRRKTRKSSKDSPDIIIDIDETDGGINAQAAYAGHPSSSGTQQSPSFSHLSVLIPTTVTGIDQAMSSSNQLQYEVTSSQHGSEEQDELPEISPHSFSSSTMSPPITPQRPSSAPDSVTGSLSPPISPQQNLGVHGLIPPMDPQQKGPQKKGPKPKGGKKTALSKYNCGDCGKSFTSNAALTNHHRTHTGSKPFECDVCGKHYSAKQSLKNHIHTHFKEK